MTPATKFFRWLIPRLDGIWDDAELQAEVGERVSGLCAGLRWEAGPDLDKAHFFALSPNRDPELLPVTVKLISDAPEHQDWSFYPVKPAKNWTARHIEAPVAGKQVHMNFDDWTYTLTSFQDGEFFDVNLYTPRDHDLEPEALRGFGDMFVESQLGEQLYMELIDRVTVQCSSDKKISIEHLRDQLQELRRS